MERRRKTATWVTNWKIMLQIIFHCKIIWKKKKEWHIHIRFHIHIVLFVTLSSLALAVYVVHILCPLLLFSLCIGHFIITICLGNNVSILQWFIIVDGKCDQMTCVLLQMLQMPNIVAALECFIWKALKSLKEI